MKEHERNPPISQFYDLADLSEAGDAIRIVASPEQRQRLAHWAGVEKVERFEAVIELSRLAQNRFGYRSTLSADIVQSCIVTLEPVSSHLDIAFSRELQVVSPRRLAAEPEGELTLAAGDDDAPEEIASQRYDLAGPLLEEFSLAIDPYPRAPGVEFEPPRETEEDRESPFAVLKRLKERGR